MPPPFLTPAQRRAITARVEAMAAAGPGAITFADAQKRLARRLLQAEALRRRYPAALKAPRAMRMRRVCAVLALAARYRANAMAAPR